MCAEPCKPAIVIVNWNQAEETIDCARSVAAAEGPPRIVWVVDNGSAAEDRARITAACPQARLLASQENLGFGGANNLAMRRALAEGCEAILLLNNDARIDSSNLDRLQQSLDRHPDLAVIGPLIWDADQKKRLLSAGGRDIGLFAATHLRQQPGPGLSDVFYVPGTCALVRCAALQQIGMFDERYFFSGEMADLCARARQQGWRSAVDSGAEATHRIRHSASPRRQLYVYYEFRNRFLFVRKFHSGRHLALFAFWTLRCSLAATESLFRHGRPAARAIALAAIDGWAGRFGGQNARISAGRYT